MGRERRELFGQMKSLRLLLEHKSKQTYSESCPKN